MNPRAEKSTLLGGAGKGGGGLFRTVGALSMISERERERETVGGVLEFFFLSLVRLEKKQCVFVFVCVVVEFSLGL